MLTNLWLILWKNLLIRKRHWILTTVEILIPILLFTLVSYGRSKISGLNKQEITEATYQPIYNKHDIYQHVPVGELNLWYVSNSDFTENIIRKVQNAFQITGEAVQNFGSRDDLLKHFRKNSSKLIVAVNFNGNDVKNFDYEIGIYDKYLVWDTEKLFLSMISFLDESSSKYIYKGFAAFQLAIDSAYMEILLNNSETSLEFNIQGFPYPPYTDDSGLSKLFMHFLPLITIFSFVFLCPAVLQRVGEEKHSGSKEFMKMVGMKSSAIWLGWIIHALSTNMISIVAIIILMKVPFWGVPYPPIEYSDGGVLFVFLFLYCMAAITFCFVIATIFNTPSIATVLGILVWIFSYFIPQTIVNSHENLSWMYKILFALFPNMALNYGYSAISVYESREVGITWNNIFHSGSGGDDDITMGNVLVFLIFDAVLFMLLTLYIENVKPGQYGIAKPFSFPLLKITNFFMFYWSSRKNSTTEVIPFHDDVETGEEPCIKIHNLFKKFYNHLAVDNLSMNVYKNRITVLLGHNGAGKTTTMSILTGMIDATKGSVVINGKNIKIHTDAVRKMMGLCPQHNLLYPDLTVKEHLKFFAMLKGLTSVEAELEAKKILKTFDMLEKENSMTCTLSGGMKRKVCLGMAVIGNSEVLVLDEPTSGMDPESRRKVWNLLKEYRKSRTILITTHFMEEADVLGDCIAIMANGRLQCYGTPDNLKRRYSTGYHLSLMLDHKQCVADVTDKIKEKVPTAELLRENGLNVVYLLPLDEKSAFADLFQVLEQKKSNNEITSMGLSITTLNDVFLKAKDEVDGNDYITFSEHKTNDLRTYPSLEGMHRESNKFCTLMLKRWYFLRRKFCWYIPATVVTICIFLLTMWLWMASNDYYTYGGPKLNLNLNVYGKTRVYYGGEKYASPVASKMKEFYKEAVLNQQGIPIQLDDVSQGIIQAGVENKAFYKKHMVVAAEFNASKDGLITVKAMYSGNAIHALPISVNLAMNAIVKQLLNQSYSISISNTPLKPLYTDFAASELSQVTVGILWLILIPTGILLFMSNFIIFPNLEVSTNFIQIQNIAGVKTYFYWMSNIIFDFFILCVPTFSLLFLLMKVLDWLAYNSIVLGNKEIGALVVIFASYAWTSLPFTYLFSYRKTITGGFTLLLLFGIFIGIVPTVIIRTMEMSSDHYYMEVAKYLKHVLLCLCPQFALSYICVKFSQKYVENFNWAHMEPNKRKHMCLVEPNPCCSALNVECYNHESYFRNQSFGVQGDIAVMWISFIIYFLVLCFLNTESFKKLAHFFTSLPSNFKNKTSEASTPVDGDCDDFSSNQNTLHVKNLTKTFGRKRVVKNLKLELKKNKCFGLLGVNGAGKSTTFRLLTKFMFFDKGDITISESQTKRIAISESKYSEYIGYCPQEDCLNYFLSGEELLRVIARIRGYSKEEAEIVIKCLLHYFGLDEYANKTCLEYSGGNKRKLCSCIAFLGSPKVILLDEPTSGVDPASRRNFWKILNFFKEIKDTSLLLSSHSMEECENLCDEIGIMKNGEIVNKGTVLELKDKHEQGYKIAIKVNAAEKELLKSVKEYMILQMNAALNDEYLDLLEYQVKDPTKKLSELFSKMEILKNKYNVIDDYVINQISLEDVFLLVAKEK